MRFNSTLPRFTPASYPKAQPQFSADWYLTRNGLKKYGSSSTFDTGKVIFKGSDLSTGYDYTAARTEALRITTFSDSFSRDDELTLAYDPAEDLVSLAFQDSTESIRVWLGGVSVNRKNNGGLVEYQGDNGATLAGTYSALQKAALAEYQFNNPR